MPQSNTIVRAGVVIIMASLWSYSATKTNEHPWFVKYTRKRAVWFVNNSNRLIQHNICWSSLDVPLRWNKIRHISFVNKYDNSDNTNFFNLSLCTLHQWKRCTQRIYPMCLTFYSLHSSQHNWRCEHVSCQIFYNIVIYAEMFTACLNWWDSRWRLCNFSWKTLFWYVLPSISNNKGITVSNHIQE